MSMLRCLSITVPLLMFHAGLARAAEKPPRPNIVVIYADDLGYGDVQCYNPQRGKIPTPHIDRLAAEGMRFTDAHSSSGVCSPSRYTLLTGRYHWRTRLQRGIVRLWEKPLIAPERLTVAGFLQQAGYQTACIGKWHLGWDWPIEASERPQLGPAPKNAQATDARRAAWQAVFSRKIAGGPITRGFDEYFGADVPNWPPYCFIEQDRTVGTPSEPFQSRLVSIPGLSVPEWKLEAILPTLATRAADFIARATKNEAPYFLYLPLTSPHTPLAVNEPWRGKSGLNRYADFVMETDAVVGQILGAIAASGEADRTLVLFTSDNGCAPYVGAAQLEAKGHYPSGPLRGYKSDVWEGGHRVPLVVRWPSVVGANTVCDALVHQADLMATVAEIIAQPLPPTAGEDSFSLLPLLRGTQEMVREHAVSQSVNGLLAVRHGPWKLIFAPGSGGWTGGRDSHQAQLYHLGDDLGEKRNLYAEQPQRVAELNGLMQRLIAQGRSTAGPPQSNDQPVKWSPAP